MPVMFVKISVANVAWIQSLSIVTRQMEESRWSGVSTCYWYLDIGQKLSQIRYRFERLLLVSWKACLFLLADDRAKIECLTNLIDLSLNENPLGVIPPFHKINIQFLSLQNTSLTSAAFPPSYSNVSSLQTISLNGNTIRSITEKDLLVLRNTNLHKLHLHDNELSTIDRNAFASLSKLQALSLKNNRLASCDFLPTLPLLSAINLDGNQFVSLPQELSLESKIQFYSFQRNSISTIDESSPLRTWWEKNSTNKVVYLANNSLDCCRSIWFIRLLKSSAKFVGDAASLVCAGPSELAGKKLIGLDPDQLNCDGGSGRTWWTVGRIIGVTVGIGAFTLIIVLAMILIVKSVRQRRARSGYAPIDGSDDSSHPPPPLPPESYYEVEDNNDRYSINTSVSRTRSMASSEAPTLQSNRGIYAADSSPVEGSQISVAALIPPHL